MKYSIITLIIFINISIWAQNNEPYTFGKLSPKDHDITVYSNDSTANALVLYEHGSTSFHVIRSRVVIKTKFYTKIKIFNKEGMDHATIEIPIYRNKERSEKVKNINAVTHNGSIKTWLTEDKIYKEKTTDNWSLVKFTMPNIKNNSVIEYEYTLESPFLFNFTGWEFQKKIPTVYSEFHALIPGNYIYNRQLIGFQKLSKNESSLKRRCFSIPGASSAADCEELVYAMNNIPAFIEEDFMTSKKNYLSQIKFELSEFKGFDGIKHKYTKTWKNVDKEFRGEHSIGRQLKKIDYIKKLLPIEIQNSGTTIENAKNIFSYIKNHFSWNGKLRVFKDVNVKNAYNSGVGNAMEINIALINALKAVGFNVELMLLSTRKNGFPTKLYPVMTDFNYGIAKLNLNDKVYLLDATNKNLRFNLLPFKALNSYGRVMNFKHGSYWYDIDETVHSQSRINLSLKMDEDGNFKGQMNISSSGYNALRRKTKYSSQSEEDYLLDIEKQTQNMVIESYKQKNNDLFNERFEIEIENDLDSDVILLNPFIINKTSVNPFKLKERSYPIDFGYKSFTMYTLQLEIPENYQVKELPKNVAFKLPNNDAVYTFSVMENGKKISLLSRVKFSKSTFSPSMYPYLKEFYNQIIKTHKSLITLEKK